MLRFMMMCSNATSTLIHHTQPRSDITEHWTREGTLYLCAIKDLCSGTIVGYATSARITSHLAVAVLEDAMRKRGEPKGVIIHSDRGSQLRSQTFRAALKPSVRQDRRADSEGVGITPQWNPSFALVQKNVLDRTSWVTRRELSASITHWIERTYHRKRHQRALGKLTPIEYETIMKPAVSNAT